MKRKSLPMNVLVVTAVFWAFGLLGVQTSMAVKEHHQPGATEKAPASTESPGSDKMPGPASGSGPGMMGMMAGLRWDQEVNPQQVKEVFVKEAEAKAEMFLTSLDYLRKLKGVLTQEQLKKLEAQGL